MLMQPITKMLHLVRKVNHFFAWISHYFSFEKSSKFTNLTAHRPDVFNMLNSCLNFFIDDLGKYVGQMVDQSGKVMQKKKTKKNGE